MNPTFHPTGNVKRGSSQPLVCDFMTPVPFTINRRQPLAAALQKMREEGVRHLPVLEGGHITGVLSQRDAYLVESLPGATADTNTVEEAMTTDVYTVSPDAALADVASEMAAHKYGCAVVADGAQVLGIFTTVDALRALVEALTGSR